MRAGSSPASTIACATLTPSASVCASQLSGGTGYPAAAEQRNTESRPLFIAKADNLNGLFQPPPLLMQTVHHFDRRQTPSIPS